MRDRTTGRIELCCTPFVAMVKTTDFRDLDHCALLRRLHGTMFRSVFIQGQVHPRPVIVVYVATQNSSEVRFAEYDDMIETLPVQGSDYSLDVRILPGTLRRDDYFLDVEGVT